jgi:hypothetical protein
MDLGAAQNANIDSKRNHSEAKTIGTELALLRIMLERVIQNTNNDSTLFLACQPQMMELVTAINRLVESAIKIDAFNGKYLDKTQVMQFTQALTRIIQEELAEYPEILARIIQRMEDDLPTATDVVMLQ